ncbi:MAG: metal-dependent hydrolase [Arenicella sp.]|nr:metal-dependent hydrolase [Arenicella sp.]
MDPITQGVVGAAASQLVSRRIEKIAAGVIGFLSGMAADLDVLISSSTDPLLFLEFHRHFTHSLIFIPLGALVCTLAFRLVFRRWFRRGRLSFQRTYLFSFVGYATHAVLDACTTYGTQLFWPFSDTRVTWNAVSVIDPLFTLPLLIMVVFAILNRSTGVARFAAAYAFFYLGLGVLQSHRASDVAQELALSRGRVPSNLGVKPSFANLIVWKSVYEYQGQYYIDAIRMLGSDKVYQGRSVEKLDIDKHFAWLDSASQQAKDIERFRWFSNQHLALDPNNKNRIIDIRYSLIPNQVTGMWGITLDSSKRPADHVEWSTNRPKGQEAMEKTAELWGMVIGQ